MEDKENLCNLKEIGCDGSLAKKSPAGVVGAVVKTTMSSKNRPQRLQMLVIIFVYILIHVGSWIPISTIGAQLMVHLGEKVINQG